MNLSYQPLGFSQRESGFCNCCGCHCPELLGVLLSCLHFAWLVASVLFLVFSLCIWWWLWPWKMNGTCRCRRRAVRGGFAQEPSCALPGLFLIFRSPATLAQKPTQQAAPHRWRFEHLVKMGMKLFSLFMNKPNSNSRVWRLILD